MTYTISPDGSADFTSLQAAADAAARIPSGPVTLLLRPGIYHERAVLHRDCLTVIGEDREHTVITAAGTAKDPDENGQSRGNNGTFCSATLYVTGNHVTLENLTVRNDAGDGREAGQAVALYAAGDNGRYRNLNLLAHQDTLYCGPLNPVVASFIAPRQGSAECANLDNLGDAPLTRSRVVFEHCFIRGDVDFIFGSYRAFFEDCTLYMNKRGGFYTAANTHPDQPLGFVFHACRLTGECPEGEGFLGRPWRQFARTVFLNCEMDACVSPQGFCDWDAERVVTDLFGEYGTTGARADLSLRHPAEKRLTAEEAAAYFPFP